MRSKISFYSGAIFKKNLSRFWPLWAMYFIVWFCVLPLPLIGNLGNEYIGYSNYHQTLTTGNVLNAAWLGGVIISGIFAVFAAMAVYGHLYSAKSAGMIASLPIRREGLFTTSWLSGIVPMLAVNVVIFLITLAVEASYGKLNAWYLFQWLAMVSLNNVAFFGFASACAMLTGNILVLPVVYVLLNFAVFVYENLARAVMQALVFGMNAGEGILSFLSPPVFMLANTRVNTVWNEDATEILSISYTGWQTLALYCIAGLVLSALALWLYKRRRMETASDVVALNPLKPVFKYCMASGIALILSAVVFLELVTGGYGGYRIAASLLAFLLIGGFIGYFAAEMLMKKALLVFKRSWKGFAVFAAVVIALTVCLELDIFGYERRVPSPEDVSEVRIYCQGEFAFLTRQENIIAAAGLHKSVAANKAEHEAPPDYMKNGYLYYYITLEYTLKDGGSLNRAYTLRYDASSDVDTLESLLNTNEAIYSRNATDIEVTPYNIFNAYVEVFVPDDGGGGLYQSVPLTASEAYELYTECMLPDIADGNLGKIWLYQSGQYMEGEYAATIYFDINGKSRDSREIYDWVRLSPTVYSERTVAWLRAHGIEPMTRGEVEASFESDPKYHQ